MSRQSLPVRLKPRLPEGCLHRSQMEQIAASLYVELPDCIRLVQYSPTPPPDVTLPWQQTDDCGGSPIGTVKHFKKGAWA